MNRRRFLLSLSICSFIFPSIVYSKKTFAENSLIENNLRNYFVSLSSAQMIGQKYLQSLTSQPNYYIFLLSFLSKKYEKPLSLYQNNDFSKVTSEVIGRDFESNDVIVIDGWYLSSTEVNLCALCVILNNGII